MPKPPADAHADLSRRERQIMDVIFALGRATSAEVHERLPEAPHPAAVRTMLRILEAKGRLQHEKDGARHVYFPAAPRAVVQKSAVRHLLGTFFGGSRTSAIAALLDESDRPLSASERAELEPLLRKLRESGR